LFEADESGLPTLLGSRCGNCARVDFPKRGVCVSCGHRDVTAVRLSGRGTVYESTRVVRPPAGFTAAYVVGMVDLEEGPRVFALLAGDYVHGARVHVAARRLPSGDDGFAFEADGG
jgi:uncharacterized OB-fold protein